MQKELPIEEYIKAVLRYDPESGIIYWNIDKVGVKKGQPIYTYKKDGYPRIKIKKKAFPAHRVAFLLMTGEWPQFVVDHVNGDKTDNRFCNLRLATKAQNSQNSKLSIKNASGYKGVSWHKAAKKWRADICANRRLYFLGLFNNKEDAINARKKAEEELHGDFTGYKNRPDDNIKSIHNNSCEI